MKISQQVNEFQLDFPYASINPFNPFQYYMIVHNKPYCALDMLSLLRLFAPNIRHFFNI